MGGSIAGNGKALTKAGNRSTKAQLLTNAK